MNKFNINVVSNIEVRGIEGDRLEIKGILPSNSLSEELFHPKKRMFFRERIRAGAFDNAIKDKQPKLLKNHNYDMEFTTVKFAVIKETVRGLEFKVTVEDEFNLKDDIKNITGLSFGFIVDEDKWIKKNNENIRDIYRFKELMEISVLVGLQPAYSATEVIIMPKGTETYIDELIRYKLFIREQQLKILREELEKIKKI